MHQASGKRAHAPNDVEQRTLLGIGSHARACEPANDASVNQPGSAVKHRGLDHVLKLGTLLGRVRWVRVVLPVYDTLSRTHSQSDEDGFSCRTRNDGSGSALARLAPPNITLRRRLGQKARGRTVRRAAAESSGSAPRPVSAPLRSRICNAWFNRWPAFTVTSRPPALKPVSNRRASASGMPIRIG